MFDVAVIGGGIMGAPTARILSEQGFSVALIAQPEPVDTRSHEGPFGAHYDVSRLTWLLHLDPVETELSERAQADMERTHDLFGGILSSPGYLFASAPGRDEGRLAIAAADPGITLLDAAGLAKAYPILSFPPDVLGFGEAGPSGIMNPRALVAAEQQTAIDAGAELISTDALRVEIGGSVNVHLSDGSRVEARKAVVATGAFSNRPGLLPRPLALKLKQETVLLAELDNQEATRLAAYPTLVYQPDVREISDVYSAPPIRYPDGKTYLKWGCNTLGDLWADGYDDIARWYRSGRSDDHIGHIRPHFESVIPGIRANSWTTQRCVITYTAHGKPYIDELVSGRLYVAVGGNGHSAKWSPALGALAAQLVAGEGWSDSLPPDPFRVVFADEVQDDPSSWEIRDLWSDRVGT